MGDKNDFGGGAKNSLYIPMSEVEQEVIARLATSGELRVHILEWGVVNEPRVEYGDARLKLTFTLAFNRPPAPGIPIHHFDMELRTGAGMLLHKGRKSVEYGGKPVRICAGMELTMEWHIAIRSIDPKLVRMIKPGATGLTSRLQDRDTKDMSLMGNMRLTPRKQKRLVAVRRGEGKVRHDDDVKAAASKDKDDVLQGKKR